MVKFVFVLLTAVVAVHADPDLLYDLEDAEDHFQQFMYQYGKQYSSPEEEAYRFEMFKQSLIKYNKQNLENPYAEFGIHEYSDLCPDEFGKLRAGYVSFDQDYCTTQRIPRGNPPASWDWRNYNAVSNVKNQGLCGSCWSFSAIGNVEGQYAIKYARMLSLSEKELIDCDSGAYGCNGGDPSQAFTFLQQIGGVAAEQDYPYRPVQEACSFSQSMARVRVIGCEKWYFSNEDDIKTVLYTRGPLSIIIDPTDMEGYNGGILHRCNHYRSATYLHAMLLVGYGSENGIDYWVLKNSWGIQSGEYGYVRVKRGINACGIMDFAISSSIIA